MTQDELDFLSEAPPYFDDDNDPIEVIDNNGVLWHLAMRDGEKVKIRQS